MSTAQRIVILSIGVILLGATAGQHVAWRVLKHRYEEAIQARQTLERRVAETLSTHEQLTNNLEQERLRTQQLTAALESTQSKLEEASGRVSEQDQRVRELQLRVASLQQQTHQLQGELAMALESGSSSSSPPSKTVQLEKIVVSDAGDAGLHGRVLSIHQAWNFVVVDFGWDQVRIGDTISIHRNNQLVAKAKVERVQEQVCAATLLPEWTITNVQANDTARLL